MTTPTSRPLTLAADRLLAAVNGLPVRLPERERLVRALDMMASTEWTRMLVRLTEEQVGCLSIAAVHYRPHELGHLLAVADIAATDYGFEFVDVAHIAIALCVTSATTPEDGGRIAEVAAEAFGLGTLDDLDKLADRYLIKRESTPQPDPDEPPVRGFTIVGGRWKMAFQAVYALVTAASVGALIVLATRDQSVLGWLFAVGAAFSSRDSREMDPVSAERVGWARFSSRWPLHGALALVAAAVGLPEVAGVLVIQFVLTELVVAGGEVVLARHDCFTGPVFAGVPFVVRRLLVVPDGYLTGQRVRAWVSIGLIAVVPTVVVSVYVGAAWPLPVLAAVLFSRRLTGFAVVVITIALFVDIVGWAFLVAVIAGLAARSAIAWSSRPPTAAVPMPAPGFPAVVLRSGAAYRRARRLLRRSLPGAAANVLARSAHAKHPVLTGLRGWSLLQSGRFGDAKATVSDLSGRHSATRALITGLADLELSDPRAAMASLTAVVVPPGRGSARRAFRAEFALAVTRARVMLGDTNVVDPLARSVPLTTSRTRLLHSAATIRLIAENHPALTPHTVSMIAGCGFMLCHVAQYGRERRFFTFLGTERALYAEGTRCSAVIALADLQAGANEVEGAELLGKGTGAAEYLLRFDRPLEAASTLNRLADHLQATANRLAALDTRVEAVATLYWMRHQLRDLATRRLWWTQVGETVEQAMRQAAEGKDWATLAELIETARLQLAPREGENLANAAPFVRVRGVSRLEQAVWFQPGEQTPSHDLERLADAVLGPDTWWWSTWAVDTDLYWALVPPAGPISGGVLPIGRGTPLGDALFDLRDSSPIPYPGESVGDDRFALRMEHSVLFGPLAAESALARRLAQVLPPPLRERLATLREPINLAIAPARVLANVPWSVVGTGAEVGDTRLVERCRLAIAPPAGLLAALAKRPRTDGTFPLSLAVLNPGGALGDPGHDLLSASALVHFVPPDTRTVTATDELTVEKFGQILQSLPKESSVVFACHTHGGTGMPLSGGLQLRPPTQDDPVPVVLSAADLIDSPDCFPIPRQGLVLACDSADLGQVTDGEWLVLGPALLWAGAQRLVVTGFPIVDGGSVDQPLIGHLLVGDDLVDSLRTIQITRLDQWRSTGDEDVSPAIWSAHIAMGAFTPTATDTTANALGGRYVEESFVELLDSAARHAARMGRFAATPVDVFQTLALEGFYENMPKVRRLVVQTCAYAWELTSLAAGRLRRPAAGTKSTLTTETMDLVAAACTVAASARHRVLSTEHLLVAALAARGALPTIARWLSHWDGTHPEVVKEMIGDTQDHYHRLDLPTVRHLTPHVVRAVYGAFSVDLPEPGHHTPVLLKSR